MPLSPVCFITADMQPLYSFWAKLGSIWPERVFFFKFMFAGKISMKNLRALNNYRIFENNSMKRKIVSDLIKKKIIYMLITVDSAGIFCISDNTVCFTFGKKLFKYINTKIICWKVPNIKFRDPVLFFLSRT